MGSVPVQRGVCTNGPGHWLSRNPWSPIEMAPATSVTGESKSRTDYGRAAAGLDAIQPRQRQTSANPPNSSAANTASPAS